ncbi:MAG TPA: hypothetical protein VFE50_02710 [Cyclobacteriaceae bacterium]|nr:hypothetical protein [Cyclobacteriaceae bacterium]
MGNLPVEPPDELDGAMVICWAWSGEEPFGFISVVDDGKEVDKIAIHGTAICQYEGTDTVYYFICNKDWEVENDTVHNSVERAMNAKFTSEPYSFKPVSKWYMK